MRCGARLCACVRAGCVCPRALGSNSLACVCHACAGRRARTHANTPARARTNARTCTQALALLESAFGEKHWLYVSAMHNLALSYEAPGDLASARDTMQKVLRPTGLRGPSGGLPSAEASAEAWPPQSLGEASTDKQSGFLMIVGAPNPSVGACAPPSARAT